MVDKFGKVMVYVKEPRVVADFFIDKIEFVQKYEKYNASKVLSVGVASHKESDACIEFFDINIVKEQEPELNLGTPSLCFSSYDTEKMRNKLLEKGVVVGPLIEMAGVLCFNFSDIEGNYYAVQQISHSENEFK